MEQKKNDLVMLTLVSAGRREAALVVHGRQPAPAVFALGHVEESHCVEPFTSIEPANHIDARAQRTGGHIAVAYWQVLQSQ